MYLLLSRAGFTRDTACWEGDMMFASDAVDAATQIYRDCRHVYVALCLFRHDVT